MGGRHSQAYTTSTYVTKNLFPPTKQRKIGGLLKIVYFFGGLLKIVFFFFFFFF